MGAAECNLEASVCWEELTAHDEKWGEQQAVRDPQLDLLVHTRWSTAELNIPPEQQALTCPGKSQTLVPEQQAVRYPQLENR